MAGNSRTQPQTVPDPDGEAYDRMCRRQRAYNETQEACIARRRAEALDTADKVNSVAGAVPAITHDLGEARAANAARKVTGVIGKVTAPIVGAAGYDADRKAGIPFDEAAIRNYGPWAAEAVVGLLTKGRSLPATGAAELGVSALSSPVFDRLANGWRGLKDHVRDDPYWRDRAMRATDPFYLMRALGQRR